MLITLDNVLFHRLDFEVVNLFVGLDFDIMKYILTTRVLKILVIIKLINVLKTFLIKQSSSNVVS